MTRLRFSKLLAAACGLAMLGGLSLTAADAPPAPPPSPRVLRMAERAYARQAIAEARAARAEARAAEMAKAVPVPPPPRPLTVRRMARAGVPLGGPPQTVIVAQEMPPVVQTVVPAVEPPVVVRAPASVSPPSSTPASKPASPEPGVWTLDPDPAGAPLVENDGTRSVLSTGGESPPLAVEGSAESDRSGPAVTQPAIELLPTPAAE